MYETTIEIAEINNRSSMGDMILPSSTEVIDSILIPIDIPVEVVNLDTTPLIDRMSAIIGSHTIVAAVIEGYLTYSSDEVDDNSLADIIYEELDYANLIDVLSVSMLNINGSYGEGYNEPAVLKEGIKDAISVGRDTLDGYKKIGIYFGCIKNEKEILLLRQV